MGKTVQIYALIAPPMYPDPRYVGVTKREPKRRLQNHLSSARRGEKTHKARWIRRCDRLGLEVQIVTIEVVPAEGWQEAERYWIARFTNLTNSVAGGEGVLDPAPETRAKMSAKAKARCTPEFVARLVESRRGKSKRGWRHSLETRQKLSASARKQCTGDGGAHLRRIAASRGPVTAETRAKIGATQRGRVVPDGVRAKMSATWKARCTPEYLDRLGQLRASMAPVTRETRAKISTALQGRVIPDETRAKMSAAASARWERQRAAKTDG